MSLCGVEKKFWFSFWFTDNSETHSEFSSDSEEIQRTLTLGFALIQKGFGMDAETILKSFWISTDNQNFSEIVLNQYWYSLIFRHGSKKTNILLLCFFWLYWFSMSYEYKFYINVQGLHLELIVTEFHLASGAGSLFIKGIFIGFSRKFS